MLSLNSENEALNISFKLFASSDNIFDIEELGGATYFLSLSYLFLALFSSYRLRRINQYVARWNSPKIFHFFVVCHVYVRSVAFAVLCYLAISKMEPNYPMVVILFTLPDIFMISTYILLFFLWLEVFFFSHLQFMDISRRNFRKKLNYIFLFLSFILYIALGSLYAVLMTKPPGFGSSATVSIVYCTSLVNFILPFMASIVAYYFGIYVLSGYVYTCSAAEKNVSKMNQVTLIWTLCRLVRGTDLLLHVRREYFLFLLQIYRTMIMIGSLVLTEFFAIVIVLDWSFVGILLLGDEGRTLCGSMDLTHNHVQRYDSYAEICNEEKKWEIPINNIHLNPEVINDVGMYFSQKGSYNGVDIFIKCFRLQGIQSSMLKTLSTELANHSNVHHAHIVRFFGVARKDYNVYSITEYISCGSLFDRIHESRKKFAPKIVMQLAKQIAITIRYLHSLNRVHGHLNSRNILLDENMTPKVGDIGVGRLKAYIELASNKRMATAWSSPEVLKGNAATKSSDVYSYGVICWGMVTGKIPYEGRNLNWIYTHVVKNQESLRLSNPSDVDISQAFIETIKNCLNTKASRRPTFEQICFCLTECGQESLPEFPNIRSFINTI